MSVHNRFSEFMLGGVSACFAGVFTNPLEVIKTRIQLQGELQSRGQYQVHYRNVFHAFYTVAKSESLCSLQKGLVPALFYQFTMNGFRFGAYQCIENLGFTRNKKGEHSFVNTVFAGAFAGSVGAMVGSPFYMIKTQLQSRSNQKIAVGHQHPYRTMSEAGWYIYKQGGILGLWRGTSAAMARVTVGSSVQLTTFAQVQNFLHDNQILAINTWQSTLASASISGFVIVLFMTPLDVVSTRFYNQPVDPKTGKALIYNGIGDSMVKIFRTEGLYGFYKGCSASFLRLTPHTILSLWIWKELRKCYFGFANLN